MSTTLDGRKAKKNYAEFDEYISYQLQKTQTGIRSTDVFTALCGVAVFVVSYLLVFVVFDHWVVSGGFGPAMRLTLLSGLLLGTLAWLGWKVVWPFFRRVNSLYAAKTLEQASPELKSTLLNYVDLRSGAREVSPTVLGSMEKRAAVTLSQTEIDDAIDRSTLLKLSYSLLIAVVLFSLYSVASPKRVWPSIVRIFAPGSEVSVSTQTAFLKVSPGDAKVLAREFLTVTTDLAGEVPPDVKLLYTTADGQFVDEPVSMHEVEAGLKRHRCILKGVGGEGLLQNLSYRITAGDASTRDYQVTVTQPPSASVKSLRYRFPDYMELPPEEVSGPSIDTWEGTLIELTATASMPVESAKLQFSDEAEFPARCEEMRLNVAGDGITLTPARPWRPIIREDGTYPRFFRIQCRTADGATDPTPAVHSINLQRDLKPEVSALQPVRDLEVAANAIVPMLVRASDPDFRLSQLVLRMKNGNRMLPNRSIYQGNDRETLARYDLRIAELNAMPGDVITWWIEAHDNRRVETPDRILLDTNRQVTPQLEIRLRAPVSGEDVERQLERDRKRAQEKLDELDQPGNDSAGMTEDADSKSPDSERLPTDQSSPDSDDSTAGTRDEQTPPDPPADPQRPDSADGGSGGDSTEDSQNASGTETADQKDTNRSDSREDSAGTGETRSDPDTERSNSKSGQQKPVRNDGSQDDEILNELLQRNRDQRRNNQNRKEGRQDRSPEGSADEGKTDSSPTDRDTGSDPQNRTPSSDETGSPSDTAAEADTDSESNSSSGKNPDPNKRNESAEQPSDPNVNPSNPELTKDNDPSKTPGKPGSEEQPSENPESNDSTSPNGSDDLSNDSGTETQNGKGSRNESSEGDQPAGDSGTASESADPGKEQSPARNDSSDNGGSNTSPSQPASTPPDSNATGESSATSSGSSDGSSEDGSRSGGSGKDKQPGNSGKGSSEAGGGSGSPSPDGATGDGSQSGRGADGGTPDSETANPPGQATPEPSRNGSKDSDSSTSPASQNKPSSEDVGSQREAGASKSESGSATDNEPGQKTDREGTADPQKDSESSNSTSPKNSSDGSSATRDSENSGGSSKGSEPGDGQSAGGKPQQGQAGRGQSTESGGNPGQSSGGSSGRKGSTADGDTRLQPDNNANVNDAVERLESGANVHDPNLTDADPSNLEDKLKASNMVLKRLQEELDRGEVDPELLKKLGWTEDDMRRFAERLERQLAEPKPDDPAAEARRRQFEETLRSVDLESSGRSRRGDSASEKSTSNFTDRRLPAPRSHRKAYEEYIRRLARQRRTPPAGSSGK